MIDFIHPKSRYFLVSKIISLVVLILVVTGVYLLAAPIRTALSDDEKTSLSGFTELPANLPPEDYLLSDLHLPTNEVIEITNKQGEEINNSVNSPVKNTVVLGVSYNKQATQELAAKKNVNKIVIPKMGVDSEVLEGNSEDILWKGIWRMPIGSTPNQGGNTIITAHRYLHRPPSPKTFYLIDKLVKGDIITVYWEGVKYEYKVSETKIVEPEDISILHNTSDDRLTIFSCTPLFTSKQRLVVIAEKI